MELQTIGTPVLWAGFVTFVLAMLALDLGVFHKKAHAITFKEAGIWSAVWISLSLLFNAGLAWHFGAEPGLEFLTGYLIEKSLSVDNLFVFFVVFSTQKIPPASQHRVLFWGILAALVLRAAMIFGGAELLQHFHWLIYVFGGFLIFTAVRLFLSWRKGDEQPGGSIIKLVQRWLPTTPNLHGEHFFTIENGKRLATPLFMALVLLEVTDVVFALDSIPAIFAVTTDPFIVFTSNIFALLGLRSLYFLLAGLVTKFRFLKPSLAGVLGFVGVKMTLADVVHIPSLVSLAVIGLTLTAGVLASLRWPEPHPELS